MGEAEGEHFSLRWNNFHSNLSAGFHALLEGEDLVDVTLAAGGQFVQAHKIVLSVCSPYFKQLFKVNPCKHPIVILKDVCHKELVAILQFMYQGEVNVRQEELATFLKTAEMLQIKGLTGDDSPTTSTPTLVPNTIERTPQSRTQQPPPPSPVHERISVHERITVKSDESPVRPYKRLRSEVSVPPPLPASSSSVSSDTVNEDTSAIDFAEVSKPKEEPIDYESDIEEIEKVTNTEDSLVQLLGESSSHSHQDSTQGAAPLFGSLPGISQDSGGSQDGGQDIARYIGSGRKGFYQLVHSGYIYSRDRVKGNRNFWKCIEKDKSNCRGRCVTVNNRVSVTAEHSHSPQSEKLHRKILTQLIKRVNEGDEPEVIIASVPSDILMSCNVNLLRESLHDYHNRMKKFV